MFASLLLVAAAAASTIQDPQPEHWSYRPVRDPDVPGLASAWARDDIDRFVAERLRREAIEPAPEAELRILARRAAYDLTGLPPTPEQVNALVAASATDAKAFDRYVDALLGSPAHAERMTTWWLDLVRYADTTGIHADNPWNAWPYRDWVIEAFRKNMPFDEFTVKQIAGDLLPNATHESRIAASYNRLNLITREGGSQPKEFLIRYAADRVRNLSEVWLASSMGCAECHDHKFDPVSTREFYEMSAFFADIEQVGVYSAPNNYAPEIDVPSMEQQAELNRLAQALQDVDAAIRKKAPQLAAARPAWEKSLKDIASAWQTLGVTDSRSEGGSTLTRNADGSVSVSGKTPGKDVYRVTMELGSMRATGVRLELLTDDSLPTGGPGRAANGNLVISEIEARVDGKPVKFVAASASAEQPNYTVAQTIDGKKGRKGWALIVNGSTEAAEAVLEFEQPVSGESLEIAIIQNYGDRHAAGRFRLSATAQPTPRGLILPDAVRAALVPKARDRSKEQRKTIDAFYRASTPLLAEERKRRVELQVQRNEVAKAVPKLIATKSVKPMEVRIRPRGNWMDDSGDVVGPDVPAVMGALDMGGERRATRLDLARWIVRRDHPLTARVVVNRLWQMLFGRGLVVTPDDFGIQGAEPTHPELLDHLAMRFIDSDYDVRALVRAIVTSASYRMSSRQRPELAERDPLNELIARQGRFRVEAEMVRDTALFASGLLDRRVGGASVFPYQPAGYWSHLNFPRRTYRASTGADLYRRALYNHWQRQYLHPSLMAFDAPSRESCVAMRLRSNTPQQALSSLNDPIIVEAARTLATRVLQACGPSTQERMHHAFALVLQREPRSSEVATLSKLLARHRTRFGRDRDAARQLISIGESKAPAELDVAELAAWTSACRALLNLHETITRR